MITQNPTEIAAWPPKSPKHVKGTPRVPKAQREREKVESLRAQVDDMALAEWARRSSWKYLVRCARSHQELLLVAKGYREQPWAIHSSPATGDHLAWIDIHAAYRAMDLGWPIEKWIHVWSQTLDSPSAPWLAGCHGDFSGFGGRFREWLSTPPPENFPPVSTYMNRSQPLLPWVNDSRHAAPPAPEAPPTPAPARPALRLIQGGRAG